MRLLLIRVCVLPMGIALACGGDREHGRLDVGDVRKAVLDPKMWSDTKRCEIAKGKVDLRPEDVLWLIENLTSEAEVRRFKAGSVLGRSQMPAAASALWLTCEVEEDPVVYGCMVAALGRMGSMGKPYLVRLLRDRGLSRDLRAALAQSSGVKPRSESWRGNPMGTVTIFQGAEWWETVGKRELGKMRPEKPIRPYPQMTGDPEVPW